MARHNLLAFASAVAPDGYQFGWHHRVLYRWLNDFAYGRRKRIIIEMPPGHGKSEGTSRNLPAFIFGHNPNARIMACSYAEDLASEMNRDVQRIMDSEEYALIFPGTKLGGENVRALAGKPRRNSDIFDIATGRGSYKCAGVGAGIGGRRFDFGIIDDPIKDRVAANSPTMREAVWRWFTAVFLKRQAKDAGIIITTTRWHEDDLVGRIKSKMDHGDIELYDVLTLPALATDKRHPDDCRQFGEALWPWFKSKEAHEQSRLLEPRDFAALDQQDPRGEGGTEWDASLFPASIWFDEWPKELRLRIMALDPSKGKDAKHGDYSAFIMLGLCRDGHLWIEANLARRPTTQIVADGFALAERLEQETGGPLDGFGVEANQFQELLADQFVLQSRAAGFQLPVFKITNTVNKDVRIRKLTPELTTHNLRVRATPGGRALVSQLQQFPVCDHDDGPDALEMARRLAKELWGQKLQKERSKR